MYPFKKKTKTFSYNLTAGKILRDIFSSVNVINCNDINSRIILTCPTIN